MIHTCSLDRMTMIFIKGSTIDCDYLYTVDFLCFRCDHTIKILTEGCHKGNSFCQEIYFEIEGKLKRIKLSLSE